MGINEQGNTSVSTSVDRLLDVLKQNPEMTFQKAASSLGVSEQVIESWVQFLEETGDVEVVYKFTTPYISLSKKREQKMQASEDIEASKGSIDDVMNAIDSQMEQAAKMLKGKKTQEAATFLNGITKRIKSVIESMKDKNVPLQEMEVFKREIEQVDLALKNAEDENKRKKHRNAQRILEDTFKKIQANHQKTRLLAKKYSEAKQPEQKKEVQPEPVQRVQVPKFSHDELTQKIKQALEKGDLDEANRLYGELNRLYQEELPKRFEMERENLKKSLFHISKDLTFARDSEQNSRYMKARKQIMDGFNNLAKTIEDGRVADAIYTLRYIQSLFSNLPEGYEEEKKEMQARLATATNQIAKLRAETIIRITKNYSDAATQLRADFENAISTKDLEKAQQSYSNLKVAFQKFPSELVPEKTDAHVALLGDFQKLSSLFKDIFVEQNNSRINRITEQINILNEQIKSNSVEEAQKTYNRIQILIQEISDYYFEQKVDLQNQLIESYKNLSDLSSVYYKEEFTKLSGEINSRIIEGERYIQNKNYELAEQTYVKALDLYTQLKPGFMDKKKALRDSLFEFYRKIMFMKDMSIIEKNSRTVYEAYSQIISLIIDAHHNIALNDVHSLPTITTQIDQAMTRIPDEVWQKNPSVQKEIEKLRQETKLYKLLKQYDEKRDTSTDIQSLENEIKTLIVGVSRDSPEDTNLIDYAKSILQNKNVMPEYSNQNRQTTISKPVVTQKIVSEEKKEPEIQENPEEKKEELEEEEKSKEFEKTVSAALMLSALEENSKDDLPDLSDEIEKRNKMQKEQEKTNTKEHHKNKISSNIFRLKEMLKHK